MKLNQADSKQREYIKIKAAEDVCNNCEQRECYFESRCQLLTEQVKNQVFCANMGIDISKNLT